MIMNKAKPFDLHYFLRQKKSDSDQAFKSNTSKGVVEEGSAFSANPVGNDFITRVENESTVKFQFLLVLNHLCKNATPLRKIWCSLKRRVLDLIVKRSVYKID